MRSIDYSNTTIAVELLNFPGQKERQLNILSTQDSTQDLVKELRQWQGIEKGRIPRESSEGELPIGSVEGKEDEVVTIPSWDHDTYKETVWAAFSLLKPGGEMRGCIPGRFIACGSSMGKAFNVWFFRSVQKWQFVRASGCGGEVLCIFSLTKPDDMVV